MITHSDGNDLDALMRSRLRSWYHALLMREPAELLPARNMAQSITLTEQQDGWMSFRLPLDAGRLLSVRIEGWLRPVTILNEIGGPLEDLAHFPGMEPTNNIPLALRDGRLIKVCPAGPIAELIMTAPPADGSYEFDASLLEKLPTL